MLDETPDTFLSLYKSRIAERLGLVKEDIDALLVQRNEARKNKDFAKADQIRKDLLAKGIIIMDLSGGNSDWYYSL